MWTIILRRALFVVALLVSHPASAACSLFVWKKKISILGWGAVTWVPLLLAMWLAGRKDWWRNGYGWARFAVYIAAFIYGACLYAPVSYWVDCVDVDGFSLSLPPDCERFQWPGLHPDDFAMSLMEGLGLLFQVWLVAPIFRLSRFALVEEGNAFKQSSTITIASIMLWTILASFIVALIHFLTLRGIAPKTHYDELFAADALRQFALQRAPMHAISVLVTWLIAWGWSANRWRPFMVLAMALPLSYFLHDSVYRTLDWIGADVQSQTLMTFPFATFEYVTGQVFMVWTAFGVARLLGVRLKRGELGGLKSPITE